MARYSPFICQYSGRKSIFVLLFFAAMFFASTGSALDDFEARASYAKTEYRISMRDGTKLYTAVYAPRDFQGELPILLTRTPYGVGPYGPDGYPKHLGPLGFAEEKFIFAWQDVRGRFTSEGDFVDVRPVKETLQGASDTDETTDTFDTIDWLVKNIPRNNGKAGMIGTSYSGYYTSCGLIRAHPALLAASPQAPMANLYRGDDAYHNGAFFLAANFSFYRSFVRQNNPIDPPRTPAFDYGTNDSYQFYLRLGALAHSESLLHNPYWTDMYRHTTEDAFWKAREILPYLTAVKPAVLVVGGWYDAEDLSGTLATYRAIKRQSPETECKLVMGPWSHGAWNYGKGDKLGASQFGADTAEVLRAAELGFFKQYLKGGRPAALPEALVFETGSNQWRCLPQWPPPGTPKRLYFASHHKLALKASTKRQAFDEYRSDPANPVPYMAQAPEDMVKEYMVGDQRFLHGRPDVVSYLSAPLREDLTVAGPVSPRLFVSSSATDSDFDVKLIDVYPIGNGASLAGDGASLAGDGASRVGNGASLGGFEQLVRGEPFRAKFRHSFEKPEPLRPGTIEEIHFQMPDVYHCFKKGHRVMIQLQSSWFPLTDRNPQTFTGIPDAAPEQFVQATERIYRERRAASYVEFNADR